MTPLYNLKLKYINIVTNVIVILYCHYAFQSQGLCFGFLSDIHGLDRVSFHLRESTDRKCNSV